MRKKIKYIAFYNLPELNQNRASAPSAIDKINYIINSLDKLNYCVELYSPSWIVGKGISLEKKIKKKNNVFVFSPTLGSSTKFTTYLSILMSWIWLLKIMIFNTRTNEKIIVYHSPWLSVPVLIAKKLKKLKIILEIEEIYQDVEDFSNYLNKQEFNIIKKADAYILSTEQLITRIKSSKPHLILYGDYTIYAKKENYLFHDKKIHLLYAGIIDSHKAGAFNAIEAAPYLDERYIIHILGFGEIEKLTLRIEEINKTSKCKIIYEGIKRGQKYIEFCQSCHIGLSTQGSIGSYTETSFPSKILSYLGMGLNVVSCDIKCVSTSQISSLVNFYSGSSQDIAKAITNINLKSPEYIKIKMQELNNNFLMNINQVIR